MKLSTLLERIQPADQQSIIQAQQRQPLLTKPVGALGELEAVSARLAGVFATVKPDPHGVSVLLAAADHGVTAEGISLFSQEVTREMVRHFLIQETAAVNVLARSVGAQVYVMDAGMCQPPSHPRLIRAAVREGTRNLRNESAMTRQETHAMILAGAHAAADILAQTDILIPAEMGIGNTTAAAAMTARLLNLPVAQVTGRGGGANDEQLAHKIAVIEAALQRNQTNDPLEILTQFGGYEIAAMLGMMLETAAQRKVILLDGFVEGAAALVGVRLCPSLVDYLFAAGECAEQGHAAQLQSLGLRPLLRLGLRLGEGTGGLLAAPLILAAAATLREMQTFAEAGVPHGI